MLSDKRARDFERYCERSREIGQPLRFGVCFHLWLREADAPKDVGANRNGRSGQELLHEFPGEHFGLIEATETEPPRVERYRDDQIRER